MNTSSDSATVNLGPFHGSQEGRARVFAWLTGVIAAMLFIGPWLIRAVIALHGRKHGAGHPFHFSILKLVLLDLLGAIMVWSYRTLWKRLSVRIAEGGADGEFLDRIRFQTANLVQGLVFLLLMILVFQG